VIFLESVASPGLKVGRAVVTKDGDSCIGSPLSGGGLAYRGNVVGRINNVTQSPVIFIYDFLDISTGMDNRLRMGKPSQYITSHPG